MPSYNISIDDVSPLWMYSGQWYGDSKNDTAYLNYLNGTFKATNIKGAGVSLMFNGTAVWLYGSKRGNHDNYSVTMDGQSTPGSSFSQIDQFQTELYSKPDLQLGSHSVTLTNTRTTAERPWLDIDWGVITVGDGDTSTDSFDEVLDDTSANFTWGSGWANNTSSSSQSYFKQTLHATNTYKSQATLKFYGSAVALYGAVSDDHDAYTISLDGSPTKDFTGYSNYFHAQTLLYYASGLELTEHTLAIVNNANDSTKWMDVDFAVASSWRRTSSNSSVSSVTGAQPTAAPTGAPIEPKSDVSIAAVAGGAVGGAVVLVALALLAFCLLRRHRRKRAAAMVPVKSERVAENPFAVSGPHSGGIGRFSLLSPLEAPLRNRYGSPASDTGLTESSLGLRTDGSSLGDPYSVANSQDRNGQPPRTFDLPPPGYDQVIQNGGRPEQLALSMMPIPESTATTGYLSRATEPKAQSAVVSSSRTPPEKGRITGVTEQNPGSPSSEGSGLQRRPLPSAPSTRWSA